MHEARLGADNLGEMSEESDDVVLDLALDFIDARDIEGRVLALGPDRLGCRFRDGAELSHGVGRVRLDFEPDPEARLRFPDRGHLRSGIARDHARLSCKSRAVADRAGKLNSRSATGG